MDSDRCPMYRVGRNGESRSCGQSGRARIWESPVSILAVLAVAVTASIHAHHNFGGTYDAERVLTVRGTVAEVRYVNPHIRIVIDQLAGDGKPLRDAHGDPVSWTGETMSVRVAQRRNFTRRSLKVGQVISLRGWASRKEGRREMGVSAIIQETGHVFLAREHIGGGRRFPPAPYPGLVPGQPAEQ